MGEQTAEWERESALQVAITALQQNPDINVSSATAMRWLSVARWQPNSWA
ncbi:MAG TPA: hypothetical protein VMT24_05490 [Aggregatilineaceae bacterium]|nr:hypothetical protein [Aggregatilineaceae bacterium]